MESYEHIVFGVAVPGQANEISKLVNSVYRGENSKKGWTTEAYFLKGIRINKKKVSEIINTKDNVILTAIMNSKVIGCVHLEKFDGYSMLGLLSVGVNCQTFGIGKKLIALSEQYVKEKFSVNEMRMKVIGRRKELIDYYIRRGYSLTGEREEFKPGPDVFGEPADGDLCFVTLTKKL
jgi:hypothetical protein